MTQLDKYKKQHGETVAKMRAMLESAELSDGGKLTVAESLTYQLLDGNRKEIEASIDRETAAEAAERTAPAVHSSRADENGNEIVEKAKGFGRGRGRKYAELFGSPAGQTHGFKDINAWFDVVRSGQYHPGLQAAAFESLPSTGGFSVPPEFAAQMLDESLEGEIVRPRCQLEPMQSNEKTIWGFDVSDSSAGALYGGFTAQWLQEGGSLTAKDAKLRMIKLTTKKLGLYGQASNELIADGPSFEGNYGTAMVKALGWHLDYAFLNGTGAGQPKGVLNDAALITVTKEAGQATGTLMYENVVKMFARLHPALVQEAVWVANPTTIPQLLLMTVKVKNVAGTENVGGSAIGALQGDGSMTLLTRPVIFTEKVPQLSTKGDIMLLALSQYVVGLRPEMGIEKSAHVGFQSDLATYRGILRADGQGKWAQAYVPRNGTSLSWAVALENR
jgi:HK97 family phage major capsid protein